MPYTFSPLSCYDPTVEVKIFNIDLLTTICPKGILFHISLWVRLVSYCSDVKIIDNLRKGCREKNEK